MLQQGLVLLIAGMGIAIAFLTLLASITMILGKIAPRFEKAQPATPATPSPAANDVALAIAIAVADRR
jgi:sodium pump decarboxylase gamma subunit